ncbi:MAG: hypothetical protein LAO03_16815 [Acidobacteriia bacterium]|nr:hypothetical protein [Terriglobia bacterium]
MLDFARKLFGRSRNGPVRGFCFDRPLVLLQSDDWGRVGVRDREGYELLRADGVRLGQHPYDFYTLETAEDVIALRDLLKSHRDSTGRSASLVMNFLLANLDFPRMAEAGLNEIHVRLLTDGLPGKWKRPGLFEAYRQGTADGVFHPALHGLIHFCCRAVEHALAKGGERSALLKSLWKAETPYIYWRMPWVGYEYCNPERPHAGFLSAEAQSALIGEAVKTFTRFFSASPVSACAPGYRANHDTHAAWSERGIRVAQNGSGAPLPPHMNDCEILNLYRTIDFEPTQHDLPVEKYLQLADACFARGVPVIISVHSINFHSTLKDFRGPTLRALDGILSALERKYPNLLYVHDGDLYDIVTRGRFKATHGPVSVKVKQQEVEDLRSMVGWGE